MNKKQLMLGIEKYFDGYQPAYFITLNTRITLSNSHRIEHCAIDLNRKVSKLMEWLKEYVMGEGRQGLMRAVSFNELGEDSGILHCHIIVALAGGSKIPLSGIQNFVDRKWGRFVDKNKNGERAYWERIKLDKRLHRLKAAIDRAAAAPRFEYELDTLTQVRSISDVAKALGYSLKQYLQFMTAHQYCSVEFH